MQSNDGENVSEQRKSKRRSRIHGMLQQLSKFDAHNHIWMHVLIIKMSEFKAQKDSWRGKSELNDNLRYQIYTPVETKHTFVARNRFCRLKSITKPIGLKLVKFLLTNLKLVNSGGTHHPYPPPYLLLIT